MAVATCNLTMHASSSSFTAHDSHVMGVVSSLVSILTENQLVALIQRNKLKSLFFALCCGVYLSRRNNQLRHEARNAADIQEFHHRYFKDAQNRSDRLMTSYFGQLEGLLRQKSKVADTLAKMKAATCKEEKGVLWEKLKIRGTQNQNSTLV